MTGSVMLSSMSSRPAGASTVLASAGGGGDVSFPILPALILTPMLGALAILLTPARRSELFRPIAVLASIGLAVGGYFKWKEPAAPSGPPTAF